MYFYFDFDTMAHALTFLHLFDSWNLFSSFSLSDFYFGNVFDAPKLEQQIYFAALETQEMKKI